MSDQANPMAVESDAVEAIAALLDGPEGEPEEEREEEPEESQEEPEAEAETEDEAEEESEPEETPEETEELNWNGETKKVTKSELKELAQKGFDYTQKTQQLAAERKEVETTIRQAQQSMALQQQQIEVIAEVKALDAQLKHFEGVNWHQLAEQDPVQYLKLNQSYRDLKEEREGKVQTFQQQANYLQHMQSQQYQEILQREAKALSEMPEFKGEKAQETKAQVKAYLREAGFNDEEISSVVDSRHVKVAWEASQWRKLQASKANVTKKVADVPKVVKPGTNKPQVKQADRDTYADLRKTGRGEYAAKLIEKML
jgi:hypothetical protein